MGTKKKSDLINDIEYFERYRETNDVEIRNAIVAKYLYLAEIISKKFLNRGVEYDDIYQVGCIALIKAVERFDTKADVKFISYATPTIIGEIKRFFRDKASVIRIPRRIYEVYQKVNHAREYLIQINNRIPTVEEIAIFLNLTTEEVIEIIESWNVYNMQSFNQTVYSEDDLELHETIGEEDSTFSRIDNRDFIKKTLSKFDEGEKKFIEMRYFGEKTQKEIAQALGVSQMYISRMEHKTIEKFRKILNKSL